MCKRTHTQGHAQYHTIFLFCYNWPVTLWWTQSHFLTFTCNFPFVQLYDVILLEVHDGSHGVSTDCSLNCSCSLFLFPFVITFWIELLGLGCLNPVPCVVVSCLWQGIQAGQGLAHHWRQQIQYLSAGGQSAPVQRVPLSPQTQSLFQGHQGPVAGIPSAVLQPTA